MCCLFFLYYNSGICQDNSSFPASYSLFTPCSRPSLTHFSSNGDRRNDIAIIGDSPSISSSESPWGNICLDKLLTHWRKRNIFLQTIAEMSIEEREELLTLQPGAEPVDNDDGDEVFVSPKGPPSVDDSLSSSSSGVLATLKIADGADPVTRRIILESQKDGSKRILLSDLEENISIIFHRFLQPGNNNNNSKAALKITSIGFAFS